MADEKDLYGKWIDADEDAVTSVVTTNLTLGAVEADAFKPLRVKLVDENTTTLELRHIETGALFWSTWIYIEEEEKTNGES